MNKDSAVVLAQQIIVLKDALRRCMWAPAPAVPQLARRALDEVEHLRIAGTGRST